MSRDRGTPDGASPLSRLGRVPDQAARLAAGLWSQRRHPRYLAHLFEKKLRFARRYRFVQRHPDDEVPVPPPLAYRLMLTFACNLRCPMCMLWGETGWLPRLPEAERRTHLSMDVILRLLDEGRGQPFSLVLSGGEPLLHPDIRAILRLLRSERRFATLCTNGLGIPMVLDAVRGNPYATFLVSLDGNEAEHDAVRGPGVFARVTRHIAALKALRPEPYVGVQFTIMPHNVAGMERFAQAMVRLGVNFVLFNPSWFLEPAAAESWSRLLGNRFHVPAQSQRGYERPCPIPAETLRDQLRRLRARRWPIQISCYLKDPSWVEPFLEAGPDGPGSALCTKQWLRMDVLPDGSVTPCGQFPDLRFGNLRTQSVRSIWNSPAYRDFRQLVRKGPLPVCKRCDSVYLYDPGRRIL